jgi:hypothetical protein
LRRYGVVHGGTYADLRAESLKFVLENDFEGKQSMPVYVDDRVHLRRSGCWWFIGAFA